jgi:hypothetical protein
VQRSSHAVKKTGADLFIWITDRFWPFSACRDRLKTTDSVEKVGFPKTLEH